MPVDSTPKYAHRPPPLNIPVDPTPKHVCRPPPNTPVDPTPLYTHAAASQFNSKTLIVVIAWEP